MVLRNQDDPTLRGRAGRDPLAPATADEVDAVGRDDAQPGLDTRTPQSASHVELTPSIEVEAPRRGGFRLVPVHHGERGGARTVEQDLPHSAASLTEGVETIAVDGQVVPELAGREDGRQGREPGTRCDEVRQGVALVGRSHRRVDQDERRADPGALVLHVEPHA